MTSARSLRWPAAVLAWAAAVAWALRRYEIMPVTRYVVEGPSMEPAYHDGDRVLVNRIAYRRRAPCAGDVVVLRDPDDARRCLIKRVARPPEASMALPGEVFVLGDNAAASRDSRAFGPVPRTAIIGRAWLRY